MKASSTSSDDRSSKQQSLPAALFLLGAVLGFVGGAATCGLLLMGKRTSTVTIRTVHTPGLPDQNFIEAQFGRTRWNSAPTPTLARGPHLLVERGESGSFEIDRPGTSFLGRLLPAPRFEFNIEGDAESSTSPLVITTVQ
jgi:hypothetical protein